MDFFELTIDAVKKLTPDALEITFEVPQQYDFLLQYTPGQYITIEEEIMGSPIRRSYSICSAPHEGRLSIGVKRLKGGKMSEHIHKVYTPGRKVKVSRPEGKFVINTNAEQSKTYRFVVAGSGITPAMSMIKSILEHEPLSKCDLLYGSRDESNIIYKDELESLSKRYEGQLQVKHTLSRPERTKKGGLMGIFSKGEVQWQGEKGRIDLSKLKTFFADVHKNDQIYICGPGDLIATTENYIASIGIDKSNIHREYFSTPKTDQDVKGADGAQIEVTLDGSTFTYTSEGKKSILEELIDMGKNPPYSCTSGACSTCIAKVTEGKAEMEVCFALEDDEVAAGYILTCQAKATTDKLKLKFE